jgi:simple sugar transport system ATP-binding protein
MVEIARAVLHQARIIIFDEPTASLTPEEKKYFFDLMLNLKARGVSVIFISHALEEALLLADRITVLRDGQHVVTDLKQNFDRARIVQAMVGRDLSQTLYGQKKTTVRPPGECVLGAQPAHGLDGQEQLAVGLRRPGDRVFGLVGAGRTETFKVVAGLIKRDFFHGGEVLLRGRPVRYRVARQAVADGIAYITEDRKVEGFFETMSITQNIYMGWLGKLGSMFGLLQPGRAAQMGEHWSQLLKVRAISRDVKVIELSGGNQRRW